MDWISSSLAPLRDGITDDDYRRLEAALCLTMGGEAFVVLREVPTRRSASSRRSPLGDRGHFGVL
jgi:hypothetical protein